MWKHMYVKTWLLSTESINIRVAPRIIHNLLIYHKFFQIWKYKSIFFSLTYFKLTFQIFLLKAILSLLLVKWQTLSSIWLVLSTLYVSNTTESRVFWMVLFEILTKKASMELSLNFLTFKLKYLCYLVKKIWE